MKRPAKFYTVYLQYVTICLSEKSSPFGSPIALKCLKSLSQICSNQNEDNFPCIQLPQPLATCVAFPFLTSAQSSRVKCMFQPSAGREISSTSKSQNIVHSPHKIFIFVLRWCWNYFIFLHLWSNVQISNNKILYYCYIYSKWSWLRVSELRNSGTHFPFF